MVVGLALKLTEVLHQKYAIQDPVQFTVGGPSGLRGQSVVHRVQQAPEQDTEFAIILSLSLMETCARDIQPNKKAVMYRNAP